jgi:hypothetical protein
MASEHPELTLGRIKPVSELLGAANFVADQWTYQRTYAADAIVCEEFCLINVRLFW